MLTLEDKLAFQNLQMRGALKITVHISSLRAQSLVLQGAAVYDGDRWIAENLQGHFESARAQPEKR